MSIEIKVGGHICVIDDEDWHLVQGRKIYLVRVRTKHGTGPGHVAVELNGKRPYLHRLIVGTPKGMVTDHIDGNTLNNCRSNLRICTPSQNGMNRGPTGDNRYGLKGVVRDKPRKTQTWSARIMKDGKRFHLGRFKSPEEAHAAYCAAAPKYHGEFARTA